MRTVKSILIAITLSTVLFSCSSDSNSTPIDTPIEMPPEESTLNQGLKAYYPFNGNSNDESDFDNNGIIDTPILTTNRFNQDDKAYLFNGNDDIIRVLDNNETHLYEDFSIAAWINPNSIKTQTIIRKGSAQISNPILGAYGLSLSGTNNYTFSASTDTEAVQINHLGYSINEWQFIVGVKEGNNLSMYINGVKVVEEATINGDFLYDGSTFLIGTRLQLPSSTFDGKIDDIRIYDRALSDDEIQELFSITDN